MRNKTAYIKIIAIPLVLAALAACSGKNSSAPVTVDTNGKHPDNWVQQHWVVYKQQNGGSKEVSSSTSCSECHGSDLSGGISKVSCFGATFNGMYCHANDDHTLGHPSSWADPTSPNFHGVSTFNGEQVKGSSTLATSCGLCHATDSNKVIVGDAPSCLSSDPKWGISCHVSSPAVTSMGCGSCHSAPPAGSALPNRAGAHAAHLALTGVTCSSCHSGYGSGTDKHATGAFLNHSTAYIRLASAYSAESGGFSYVGGKCSAVSCHGGKQSPLWNGGTIGNCLSCHQLLDPQAPQYNSFYSGNYSGTNLHQFHLATTKPGGATLIFCTDCHNQAKLTDALHFGGLSTQGFDNAPGNTIGGGSTSITSYDLSTRTCSNSCHTLAPSPAPWN